MVCAWQPQGGPVAHACISCHDVLQRHKHCMAHVQSASDIWWRHGHGEWLASGRLIWLELATLFPPECRASKHSRDCQCKAAALYRLKRYQQAGLNVCGHMPGSSFGIPVIQARLSTSCIKLFGQRSSCRCRTCVDEQIGLIAGGSSFSKQCVSHFQLHLLKNLDF